jgi:hypothetical protein
MLIGKYFRRKPNKALFNKHSIKNKTEINVELTLPPEDGGDMWSSFFTNLLIGSSFWHTIRVSGLFCEKNPSSFTCRDAEIGKV